MIVAFVNLFILIAVLFFATRKSIAQFVDVRAKTIRQNILEVSEELTKATESFEEATRKFDDIDNELRQMAEDSKSNAEKFREHVISEARAAATSLISDSQQAAQFVFEDVKNELSEELGFLVVDRAENFLRDEIKDQDRQNISEVFQKDVGVLA